MIYAHYSALMAKSMSANRPGPDDGEYEHLLGYLRGSDGPILELACGYGRLLLHILERGFPIVGTDASPEMLAHCRTLAEERGLTPELREQFMQRLKLARKFGLIFIADGTFSLIVEDQDVDDLFGRVWEHLNPGGAFLFDFFAKPPSVAFEGGHQRVSWVKASDGSILVSKKIESYDAETKIRSCLQIHDHYVDGNFVASQAYDDPMRIYDPAFVMKKLQAQGFVDIRLSGAFTDDPPNADEEVVTISCRKPAT